MNSLCNLPDVLGISRRTRNSKAERRLACKECHFVFLFSFFHLFFTVLNHPQKDHKSTVNSYSLNASTAIFNNLEPSGLAAGSPCCLQQLKRANEHRTETHRGNRPRDTHGVNRLPRPPILPTKQDASAQRHVACAAPFCVRRRKPNQKPGTHDTSIPARHSIACHLSALVQRIIAIHSHILLPHILLPHLCVYQANRTPETDRFS